ncbi:hypothetical protein D187_006696 [Cystobacter fuscus DSM 2262]|uniref:Uncharacterized protein n=1 Tax=Cystobacter fuscus (strain ATCC 25194 / DSM 2262 / NBRC 100088 / M29) TaxID=1242864 RepID=S9QKD0_CYSF2|nr:DUF58 domain-containing protein [Cystobacter fuscus]EPX56943.1 hypothetical protein D187_006696 [Cystobacter fuscus DSM 2262]
MSPSRPSSPWRRLRATLRPPRTLKVTGMGRTYLVVTFGVGLGALNTGNNLLYLVLGLLLSVIILSGVLSERCLRDLSVRRVGGEGAFAGEPFAFRWALTRREGHAFALTLSEVDVPLTGEGGVGHLPAGVEHVVRADLTAPRRGPVKLVGVRVTTTWPLGLFAKTRVFPLPGTLLVFPRRGFACATPEDAATGHVGEAHHPHRMDGTGDLAGLRELGEGEDSRRVHWLKSASVGKLLKVEREREERRTYVLEVRAGLADEALERRCEEVAEQAHRLLEAGHEVGLELPGQRLRPGAGSGQERLLLRALAWVGFEEQREEAA